MSDTNNLKPYVARNAPVLDAGRDTWVRDELKQVQDSIRQLIVAAKALEARLVAGGL